MQYLFLHVYLLAWLTEMASTLAVPPQWYKEYLALTGVAQWVGHCSAKRKVAGSIPSQGTGLGGVFSVQLGHIQEATD